MPTSRTHCQPPGRGPRRAGQYGFNLIEVLVTLVLLCIGLLGLAGLQARSLKNSHTSFYRTVATQQAYDIADRISTNLAGVARGDYDSLSAATPTNCWKPACDLSTTALTDQCEWRCATAAVLPAGSGAVRCVIGPAASCVTNTPGSNRIFEVTVSWTEQGTPGNVTQHFVTRFVP